KIPRINARDAVEDVTSDPKAGKPGQEVQPNEHFDDTRQSDAFLERWIPAKGDEPGEPSAPENDHSQGYPRTPRGMEEERKKDSDEYEQAYQFQGRYDPVLPWCHLVPLSLFMRCC